MVVEQPSRLSYGQINNVVIVNALDQHAAGASLAAFSSRYDPARDSTVVYEIDSPIGRIDFIVSCPPP